MSSARITIWDKVVGYIAWDEQNNSAIFESESEYIDSAINISPILHPDKSQMLYGNNFHENFKGMIPVFNDSLPDSFGNIVFKEWLEQMNIDQTDMNPVERLLYVGKRGIGALEYYKGKEMPGISQNLDLEELARVSDKIIKRKYKQEDFIHHPEALKNILTLGSSVGGAQAKVVVAITRESEKKKERLLAGDVIHSIPVDYYIVKLQHDTQDTWYREKNYVEFVYNQIARDIGINVAESRLIHEGGRVHFASKRFDRQDNQKIHKQTVSALAGFYGRNTEFGYEDIFKIIEYLDLPFGDAEQLYKQMVFNVLASNTDDHTKNFSFLMDKSGKWSLSPAYDLTFPFDPYQSFAIQHMISINKKVKQITRSDLVEVARKAGIRRYNEIIENVMDHVVSLKQKLAEFDVSKRTADLIFSVIEKNVGRI